MHTAFKNLPVLVTGGTGFIGSHLVRALVAQQAKVFVIKRPNSSTSRIADILQRVQVIEADLLKAQQLRAVLTQIRPQQIFHLACDTRHERSTALLKHAYLDNTLITFNLVDIFLKRPPEMFINVGTCEEYGNNHAPFHENLREQPVSPYGAAKVATTHFLQMLYRITQFPIVVVRPFLTYGPFQTNTQLVPYCIEQALKSLPIVTTSGEQTRELHYVTDIVEGILVAATTKKAKGAVIDLGTGKEFEVQKIVKLILKLTQSQSVWRRSLPKRPGEVDHFYCQGDLARQLLNWQPKVTLTQGLQKTIDWYRHYLKV